MRTLQLDYTYTDTQGYYKHKEHILTLDDEYLRNNALDNDIEILEHVKLDLSDKYSNLHIYSIKIVDDSTLEIMSEIKEGLDNDTYEIIETEYAGYTVTIINGDDYVIIDLYQSQENMQATFKVTKDSFIETINNKPLEFEKMLHEIYHYNALEC